MHHWIGHIVGYPSPHDMGPGYPTPPRHGTWVPYPQTWDLGTLLSQTWDLGALPPLLTSGGHHWSFLVINTSTAHAFLTPSIEVDRFRAILARASQPNNLLIQNIWIF